VGRLLGEQAVASADEIRDWRKDYPQRRELLFMHSPTL
jgi:hypothetical protein